MLINLRNALMAGKRLPYDAEVEYLETTGTQWINAGITSGNKGIRVTGDILFVSIGGWDGSNATFGGLGGTTGLSQLMTLSGTKWQIRWCRTGDPQYVQIGNVNAGVKYSIDASLVSGNVYFDVDGVRLYNSSVTFSSSADPEPVYINALWYNTTPGIYPSSGRLGFNRYYGAWRFFDADGVLLRDFIPVRVGTVGYLYDRVSGKLFGNVGTGDFVLGPDVVPVEYIESHGTEWIDTGLVATANNAFGVEVGFDTTVIDHGGTGTTNTVCICGANGHAASGFELRWQYGSESLIQVGGSYGSYVETPLTRDDILPKYIVAKNMNGHITYDTDGARIVDKSATVADVGFVTGSVLLFGVRRGTSVQGITLLWAKMKYAKFYYNNNIAESLIPVRVGTEGAMMDVLTRRIYRNQGTGAFTYGNDLKYPIPA